VTLFLGKQWTLEGEIASTVRIGAKLDADRPARLLSFLLASALLGWVCGITIALLWGLAILANEAIEPLVLRRARAAEPDRPGGLILYLVHIAVGACLWSLGGVLPYWSQEASQLPLALGILIGTLIHVSIFYSESRLQTALSSVPPILALLALVGLRFSDPQADFRDQMLMATAVVTLIYYLVASCARNIEIHEELHDLLRQSRDLAARDPLTGLQNRRAFVEAIDTYLARGEPVCVLCLDLDRFKPINDQFGHAVGDELLQVVAGRLGGSPDVLQAGRLGGDEFAALVHHDGGPGSLRDRLGRLERGLSRPVRTQVGEVSVGAALGYALAPEDGQTTADLLCGADAAMIRAKAERAGPVRFDRMIDIASQQGASMEIAFRRSLDAGEIRAALQPIAQAADGAVVGHELLARWDAGNLAFNPQPRDFIPVAERLGLLDRLLWDTLDMALPAIGGAPARLAINISPSQLHSEPFLDALTAILRRHCMTADRVDLEITEQVAFRNLETNTVMLERARKAGFAIVMDDFGTGYSSLSMLDALPLDKVKLDSAFVRQARASGRHNVLAATIRLVKDLKLVCCVEGIEDEATAQLVREYGCDLVQGYWIGRPSIVASRARRAA